jgi:molecular chaperone DnaK (HSP70)
MDGIDFHAKITRTEFEKRAEEVFKELTAPLKRFLLENDLKADDLDSVELIGGGARIPKLQSMLAEILNNKK